jgi:hypothetical protein
LPPIKPPFLNFGNGVPTTIANCAAAKTPAIIACGIAFAPPVDNAFNIATGTANNA